MKRRIFCFVTAILLMLSVSVNVFAAGATYDSVPTNSPQLRLARLLLQMSEADKEQVAETMEQIEKLQEEQKLVSNFLGTARQLQNESKENKGKTSSMPDDMYAYMNENNLAYDKTDDAMVLTTDEWESVIVLLENHLTELNAELQQKVIYLQDVMGPFLQGETTNSNQTLTNLARGQSMYGDSEAGLAVTALVVGLVLGCVITLAVQKARRKKGVE